MANYQFVQNTKCEFFPCHKVNDTEHFNCLFCYCPLSQYSDCGGVYSITNGWKDCSKCTIPHYDYDYIAKTIISKHQEEKYE